MAVNAVLILGADSLWLRDETERDPGSLWLDWSLS